MIKIFNPNDTNFSTNGNVCIKPIKCIEHKLKSLNGWYLDCEIDIKYKNEIAKDFLVVIKSKSCLNPQAFRVGDNIEYTQTKIIFRANHVFYDSLNYFLVDVRPTKLNAIAALQYINERADKKSPFIMYSDIDSISTCYFIRKNLYEAFVVFEERYSGYFQFDNWNVYLKQNISVNTDIILAYGQRLQGIHVYEDWTDVVTKLYPTGQNGITLDELYLEADVKYDTPYTKTVSFSSELEFENQTDENLKKELKEKSIAYLNENKYPKISYEISSDVNQELDIGYKVMIKHPLVDLEIEVVEYEYDLNSERTISLVFGNFIRNAKKKFDLIKESIAKQVEKTSNQDKIIKIQTDLINSLNKSGYVYIDDNEILILDCLPREKAKNVWRWGLGGLGFSSNGYEGPFETAITQDGKINANFLSVGKINTNLIEGYDQLVLKTSNTSEKVEILEKNLNTTNQNISDLDTKINGVSAVFEDFKDNEYISSISNLQDQIDGAIQFWNGPDIPTLNNYPTNEWITEKDRNNHRADIYTVIEDVDEELKQGKSYRFDKVNNIWQWIELTDNELSAVQAIANEANNRSKANTDEIKTLKETDVELQLNMDNITSRVSYSETKIENITKTTQTSEGGNHLYLEKALEQDALEYHIKGNNLQEVSIEYNLITEQGLSTSTSTSGYYNSIGKGFTALEDGWCRQEFDGTQTSRFSNSYINISKIHVKPRSNYTLFVEVRNSTNNINLYLNSVNQINSMFTDDILISNIKNGIYKYNVSTVDDLANKVLRIYADSSNLTKIGSLEYRVMIVEEYHANEDLVYKSFTPNSPSPDYPSEIKTIAKEGTTKLKITGKNLLNAPYNKENKLTRTATKNDDYQSTDFFAELEAGKQYTFSCKTDGTFGIGNDYQTECYLLLDKKYNYILSMGNKDKYTFTVNRTGKYYLRTDVNIKGETHSFWDFQIEEGKEATTYEEYKEKEVLIDLNKENLFDKNRISLENGLWINSSNIICNNSAGWYITVPIEGGATYTISKKYSRDDYDFLRFLILTSSDEIKNGVSSIRISENNSSLQQIITVDSNASYLFLGLLASSSPTEEQKIIAIEGLSIFKGTNSNPYYELSSLKDEISNDLDIVDGQAVLNEKIGKVVFDGSERWTQNSGKTLFYTSIDGILDFNNNTKAPNLISNYYLPISFNQGYSSEVDYGITYNHSQKTIAIRNKDILTVEEFKTWLSKNNTKVYYELAESQEIILSNIQIPLFEDVNHVNLVDDIETNTSIKFLCENPYSEYYALNKDLDKTNSNLSNTNYQLGQAQSDINATNTHLNNDFYDKNQIDSMQTTTEQNIIQIKNSVEEKLTATGKQLDVISETIMNGVSKVITTSGSFDDNGLHIEKTGKEMSSTVDWDGLEVIRDKGKVTEEKTLVARSSGVIMSNSETKNKSIQRPILKEMGTSISDGESIGLCEYWIGIKEA